MQEIIAKTPPELKMRCEWQFYLSDAIAERMDELGMTNKDLKEKCGTSYAMVRQWLGGGYDFRLSQLAIIATVLDIPLIEIVKTTT